MAQKVFEVDATIAGDNEGAAEQMTISILAETVEDARTQFLAMTPVGTQVLSIVAFATEPGTEMYRWQDHVGHDLIAQFTVLGMTDWRCGTCGIRMSAPLVTEIEYREYVRLRDEFESGPSIDG